MKLAINSSSARIKHELRQTCTLHMPLWPVQGPLCLQGMSFKVSVAYRLIARSSLKVSKEMEITGPHAASWTCDWLRRSSCEVMDRPPYSPISHHVTFIYWDCQEAFGWETLGSYGPPSLQPDLAPRDFHLLGLPRSTWLDTWQREASCHLLGTCT